MGHDIFTGDFVYLSSIAEIQHNAFTDKAFHREIIQIPALFADVVRSVDVGRCVRPHLHELDIDTFLFHCIIILYNWYLVTRTHLGVIVDFPRQIDKLHLISSLYNVFRLFKGYL